MKGTDAFEGAMRNAMEHFEVPYNSADWLQLEQRMERNGAAAQRHGSTALSILMLAGVLSVAVTTYMFIPASSDRPGADGPTGEHIAMVMPDLIDEETAVNGTQAPDLREEPANEMNTEAEAALVTEIPGSARAGSDAPVVDPGQVRTKQVANEPMQEAATVENTTAIRNKELDVRPSVSEGCPGEPITFELGRLPEDGIHLWNFGDGSFSNKAKPTHTFSKPGRYEVMLSHSSVSGGNFSNRPIAEPVVIHEAPSASFQPIHRNFEHTIPSVHFENRSMGGKRYSWDFGDGGRSSHPHPDHVYRTKGEYTVQLTVTNAQGCVDHAQAKVVVAEDYNLNAPLAFSPNGDGMNDTFLPEALRSLGIPFQLSIFDVASGRLLFSSDDPGRRWNGLVDNAGEPCPAGDYVWLVELKDGGKHGNFNGTVSLVR